jgi:hypothetical protein
MPFRKKDVDATAKMAVWSRELFTILLLAAYALVLVSFWWPFALPPGWPEAVAAVGGGREHHRRSVAASSDAKHVLCRGADHRGWSAAR